MPGGCERAWVDLEASKRPGALSRRLLRVYRLQRRVLQHAGPCQRGSMCQRRFRRQLQPQVHLPLTPSSMQRCMTSFARAVAPVLPSPFGGTLGAATPAPLDRIEQADLGKREVGWDGAREHGDHGEVSEPTRRGGSDHDKDQGGAGERSTYHPNLHKWPHRRHAPRRAHVLYGVWVWNRGRVGYQLTIYFT